MPRTKKTSSKLIAPISAKPFFAAKSQKGNAAVTVGSFDIALTNLDKVYWPNEGYTKFDLLRYYYLVSRTILPYLKDRPLILKRYPNGIEGQMFYQHNLDNAPEFVETYSRTDSDGKLVTYAVANNLAALLFIVNLGTIAQNPWSSTTDSISKPDYFALDLDPGDNATFEQVKKIALETKKVLEEIGLKGYPKTSGSSGIHIYVPVKPEYNYHEIVPIVKKLATLVADRNPTIATVRRMTADRKSTQVYVDYLQNIEGKTLASAYSVREKPEATVSAPIDWKEITKKLSLDQFTLVNTPARIKRKGDLFLPVLKKKQSLKVAAKKLR